MFINTAVTYSRYRLNNVSENHRTRIFNNSTLYEFNEMQNYSGIQDWSGKIAFDYIPSPNHYIRFGAGAVYHTFNPSVMVIRDTDEKRDYSASKIYAWEYSAYAEDDIQLSKRLKTNIGLHLSKFAASSFELQPRISARYLITPQFSAKASYSRMAQYLHLLTSTNVGIVLPVEHWLPSTEHLRPQTSHQTAIGFAHHFRDDYEISLEGYYKTMANVVEYMEGANLFNLDEAWEQKIVQGTGRSYGAELFVQKKTGSFTGWAGYTLAWTDRHFEELNGGKRFPYKYDRRHDISIVWMKRFEYYNWRRYKDKIIELSGAWVFGSGNCVTIPVGVFYAKHPALLSNNNYNWMRYFDYGERNGYRMKPYHRLDLSLSFVKKKKWGERRWIISVYNAYNRKNPWAIQVEEEVKEDSNDPPSQIYTDFKFVQWTLFPFIPSVSYQFKF